MTERDKHTLRKRREHLKKQRHLNRDNPALIADLDKRIKIIQGWLQPTTQHGPSSPSLTRDTFNKMMEDVFGVDVKSPGATITLAATKDVDRFWPWIATANVLIAAPKKVRDYLSHRIRTAHDLPLFRNRPAPPVPPEAIIPTADEPAGA